MRKDARHDETTAKGAKEKTLGTQKVNILITWTWFLGTEIGCRAEICKFLNFEQDFTY